MPTLPSPHRLTFQSRPTPPIRCNGLCLVLTRNVFPFTRCVVTTWAQIIFCSQMLSNIACPVCLVCLYFSCWRVLLCFTTIKRGGSGQWRWIRTPGSSRERHFVSVSLTARVPCLDIPPLSRFTLSDGIKLSPTFARFYKIDKSSNI